MRSGAAQLRMAARPTRHESFLGVGHYRYLGIAAAVSAASVALYIAYKPYGTRYGGSWTGYTLGTVGALLILWLTWYGWRKRSYARIEGQLAARLAAHVYLGLALLVVATLHTGFHFGWNVHTLAYALMCAAIASGVFGVICYARYPRRMTENRAGMTLQQMLGMIATLDGQLRTAALPLDEASAQLVERAVESAPVGGSAWRQLTGSQPNCANLAALAYFDRGGDAVDPELEDTWSQIRVLLIEKLALLARVRRDIRYKAMMDVWLYVHVPVTFALLAALLAHIVSVFFLW